MKRIRAELNGNSSCDAKCPSCNRGLGDIAQSHWHANPDLISTDQINEFVQQLRDAKNQGRLTMGRLKWVGGQPTMHPHFREIFWILAAAADEGLIEAIKISHNCVTEIPSWARHPKVFWCKSPISRKKHTPITWSPVDLGIPTKLGCSMLTRCGASLSKDGWLPCSAAIFITKVFDLEHLYKKEIPSEPWGLEELCPHCIHSMPKEWVDQYFREHKGLEKVEPTATWRKALAEFEERKGVKEKRFSLPMVHV